MSDIWLYIEQGKRSRCFVSGDFKQVPRRKGQTVGGVGSKVSGGNVVYLEG